MRSLAKTTGILVLCALGVAACRAPAPPPAESVVDERVKALADTYVNGYFERNPEQLTFYGIPGRHHDRLTDNSLAALSAWESKEDVWLADAKGIDPAAITSPALRATYAIVREALEGSIGARVCRNELWSISQVGGWQVSFGYIATIQPVGTDQARQEALARWSKLPGYIDTEIVNVREGLKQKYSTPKGNVRIVIEQMNSLITGTGADQPLLSPAQRDTTPEFVRAFEARFKSEIVPALKRYHDFLETEYLPRAREEIGVSANPNGPACYDAAVRQYSTLPKLAKDVHQLGLQQIDRITAEMKTIAERSFHTADVQALLTTVRSDRQYLFKDREELIGYSEAALARAKAAAPGWFGLLPKADVVIRPYPKFREKNGPGEYNAPAEDGSRPGLYYINSYQAEKKSKSGPESTLFHETIPGHHLQTAVALERKEIHPIGRYIFNSGYAEGWGLYAERLADEMKLYTADLDRLGMLSAQALRASRLVIDSGIHTMEWTRQQAIDYMLAHTTDTPEDVAAEIDRYIVWPGQATSYMLGMLEIQRAREEATQKLGSKFDIKAFHDRVLEDGGVPLPFLAAKIRAWADSTPQ